MARTDAGHAPAPGTGTAPEPVPTVELHRHFEAGLTPGTLARLAARHGVTEVRTRFGVLVPGVDPQDPASIEAYYETVSRNVAGPGGFDRFVDAFGLPLSLLRSLEDLEASVFEELVACAEAGSLHTELRGSPFSYADQVRAPVEEIAAALVQGVDRAWLERGVSGTFILAFSRQKGLGGPADPPAKRQAAAVARLAAGLHRPDRPVGLDIAGYPEHAFPPRLFEDALRPARDDRRGLELHEAAFDEFLVPHAIVADGRAVGQEDRRDIVPQAPRQRPERPFEGPSDDGHGRGAMFVERMVQTLQHLGHGGIVRLALGKQRHAGEVSLSLDLFPAVGARVR